MIPEERPLLFNILVRQRRIIRRPQRQILVVGDNEEDIGLFCGLAARTNDGDLEIGYIGLCERREARRCYEEGFGEFHGDFWNLKREK